MLVLLMKIGLMAFLLARRGASSVVWRHEVRWAVLAVFAERDYPECHIPARLLPGLDERRKWNAIKHCARQGWLEWDMMVRITPAGREALARFRGEPYVRLPQARLLPARSHP